MTKTKKVKLKRGRGAQKGHPKWGGKKKGTKHAETIAKEKMRAHLLELLGQEWHALCLTMIKKAKRSGKTLEFVVNQAIGKPRQNIGLDGGDENKPINIINYANPTGKIPPKKLPDTDTTGV